MNRRLSFRTVSALLVAVALLGAAGLVAGHGSFSAVLATQGPAVQDAPEPFRLNLTTGGRDEVPDGVASSGPIVANYSVRIDGTVVESGRVELDFLDWRTVTFDHTFAEPGTHEVSMAATFSLAGTDWRTSRETRFPMRVVEPGTPAALRACSEAAGGDQVRRLECHLTHRGVPGGLLSGLAASPALALVVLAVVVAGALGAWTLREFDPL